VRLRGGFGIVAGAAGALETVEFGECFFIGAFIQGDAALQAAESFVTGDERFA
jgi:hypothetical protein